MKTSESEQYVKDNYSEAYITSKLNYDKLIYQVATNKRVIGEGYSKTEAWNNAKNFIIRKQPKIIKKLIDQFKIKITFLFNQSKKEFIKGNIETAESLSKDITVLDAAIKILERKE